MDKMEERNARHRAMGSRGSGVTLCESNQSLLAKLWHNVLVTGSGELPTIQVDPHLSRAVWRRTADSPHKGTEVYDDYYLKLWSGRYEEYAKREQDLRGQRGEATPIGKDDPYWGRYHELVNEYRNMLNENHTLWERLVAPSEYYAEVAAIYEACYKVARHQQQARTSVASGTPSNQEAVISTGRINFPWRIALLPLREMKEKARQMVMEGLF